MIIMHLLILIIGVTLFPKACALNCYACGQGGAKERCKAHELGKEKVCPGSQQCAALIVSYSFQVEPYPSGLGYGMKNCLPADQCVNGTVYFGNQHFKETIQCCSTDLCNVNYTSSAGSLVENGKTCYTCTDPRNCSDTQKTLSCLGDQDRCMSVLDHNGAQNMTLIGCATRSMCGDYQDLLNMLIDVNVSKDATISCCEDDLCNSVKITDPTSTAVNPTTRLLLLVAPVMLASWNCFSVI